jgi:hypothetical protein
MTEKDSIEIISIDNKFVEIISEHDFTDENVRKSAFINKPTNFRCVYNEIN